MEMAKYSSVASVGESTDATTIYEAQGRDNVTVDLEQQLIDDCHILNDTVQHFLWRGVTVTVKDHKSGLPKQIVANVDGFVEAGEICALMGPSGSGKTTLLNVLARRVATSGATVAGTVLVNGIDPSNGAFGRLSSYVEQEDALIGSLTVQETMHFAARLAYKSTLSKTERKRRIDGLIEAFGLREQRNSIIGTPIRKGISGGQKRRVSAASALITAPKILFLDEPTSGLDSAASFEVISYIKAVAKRNKLIVIASIHQPSTSTFSQFDKLLLLSGGKPHFFGPVSEVAAHFEYLGYPMPIHINPAEFILDLMNIDFAGNSEAAQSRLALMQKSWASSPRALDVMRKVEHMAAEPIDLPSTRPSTRSFFIDLIALTHRSFIKSYRDVVAYGIRIAMYFGLAAMMGTVWLRLPTDQSSIIPFTNAIFFGGAFMSFMAVAYVPAFLEDRETFIKERANGLYGPTAFLVSNFIIGLPYLFFITVLFSVISYWLINFKPTALSFLTWVMWLFLNLLAGESLVVFISSIFPNFVISLALTAFMNGLWMCVDGFMVPPNTLNVFWRYVFHFIDYQAYVFQGMMVNEFQNRSYSCGSKCECMYQTELADQCLIAGSGVLKQYGYRTDRMGEWVGILIAIIAGYRLLGWCALWIRK